MRRLAPYQRGYFPCTPRLLLLVEHQQLHFLKQVPQCLLMLLPLHLQRLHTLCQSLHLPLQLADLALLRQAALTAKKIGWRMHHFPELAIEDAAPRTPYPDQLSPFRQLAASESTSSPGLDRTDSPS